MCGRKRDPTSTRGVEVFEDRDAPHVHDGFKAQLEHDGLLSINLSDVVSRHLHLSKEHGRQIVGSVQDGQPVPENGEARQEVTGGIIPQPQHVGTHFETFVKPSQVGEQ